MWSSVWIALALSGNTPPGWPPEECKTAYGTTVCGYACLEAYGTIVCADVPWGACAEAYGKIVCGPSQPGYAVDLRVTPKAECIEAYGKIACGYGCAEGYGEVACAPAPGGVCQSKYGELECTAGAYAPAAATPRAKPRR